jgi:4-hydroxybenzoate polyprenyltransferase
MVKGVLKSLRVKQWVKNAFLLAAIVFDRQLTNPAAVKHTIFGVSVFSLISSSVYFFNDVFDVEADRNHPKKKYRPIAAGVVPIHSALIIGCLLVVFSLIFAYTLSFGFFVICSVYLGLNLLYSKWIKHIPLLDVMAVASGFVLRVAAGVTLIKVERFSPWMYVVTTLFALFIGFGKRRAELKLLAKDANHHRKVFDGYTIEFLDQLITIVSGTTIVAYSLYTFSAPNLPENNAMMLTIPFVLFGIFRYLFLIQVKGSGGAPEEIALKDVPLQISIILWSISVLIIFYIF